MLGYHKRSAVLSAIVLPLLLAGCGSAAAKAEETPAGGPEWILVQQGRVSPSPSVRYGTASPTPGLTLPPLPTGGTSATPAPSPSCTPMKNTGVINGLDVQPGSTSAVVTWYHPGGANIVDYRITAISQDLRAGRQSEVGWTKAAPATCGFVSATVPGLEPGTHYVFSVDVVMTQTGVEGTTTRTVARSQVVSTT